MTLGFVSRSSIVLTPLVAHMTQVLTSLLALPIQLYFAASNWACVAPNSGSKAVPRAKVPKDRPSLGPRL